MESYTFFGLVRIYWKVCAAQEVINMWEREEDCQDLDDFLFTEEDGGPSER